MNLIDVKDRLNSLFSRDDTRIVLWYDKEREFIEDIDDLELDDIEVLRLEDNSIYVKYLIDVEEPDTKFLLYAPFSRNLSVNNILADVIHYAHIFSPDKVSILLEELGLDESYRDLIGRYSRFFNANSRVDAFKNLGISSYSSDSIVLGIMAVLIKEKSYKMDSILRSVFVQGLDDNVFMDLFDKFGLTDDFWSLVDKYYSYHSSKPSLDNLFTSMLITYTEVQFSGSFPSVFNKYVLSNNHNVMVFLDNFMNNSNYSKKYNQLESNVSTRINLNNNLDKVSVDDYLECDAFSLFDVNIINYYIDLLYSNKQGVNFEDIIESRKLTHFYLIFECGYNLVYYADKFISTINLFESEVLCDDINDLINQYISSFSCIDTYYRKFYYFYDKYQSNVEFEFMDVDMLEDLRLLIENMYSNTFLNKLNDRFYKLLSKLDSLNDIRYPKQWKFYRENVRSEIKKHKTVVIISDAFRYGCAIELDEIFSKNPTRKTELNAMISSIPSYTSLGMSCLLPNENISYNKRDVLVDAMSTKSTVDRENILKQYEINGLHKAIKYEDIIKMNKQSLREYFKDTQLVYVYHNQIDAIGDEAITESKVFNAVEETFTEIDNLIKKLTNSTIANHFYITSDHGFIYKRDKLEEYSKVDLDCLDSGTIHKNRRFILTNTPTSIDASLCISMDYLNINNLYATIPWAVNVFKLKGSGINFVHGGASLQECIIPLMHVSTTTGKSSMQKQVEIELIDAKRRITNNVNNLRFFQKENISDRITPLKASVYFVDENDSKISDEALIMADVSSDDPEDREILRKITLKDMKYHKNNDYYLVVKDIENGIELQRIPYIIDIAFQDDFNFF